MLRLWQAELGLKHTVQTKGSTEKGKNAEYYNREKQNQHWKLGNTELGVIRKHRGNPEQ